MKIKFRKLVNEYQKHVYSLALHILQRRDEAEDITQEVYMKLWRHINDVEYEQAKPWLMAVTRNLCIDQLRARKHIEDVDSMELESLDVWSQPSKALADSRLSEWLKNAIASLKEPYKSLLVMSDVQQKSQREIAEVLQLSASQVKVYLHRARRQLRGLLQEVRR